MKIAEKLKSKVEKSEVDLCGRWKLAKLISRFENKSTNRGKQLELL
jgi:hypothetical protein